LWPTLLGLALALLVIEWLVGMGGLARPRAENERVRARPGLGGPNAGTNTR